MVNNRWKRVGFLERVKMFNTPAVRGMGGVDAEEKRTIIIEVNNGTIQQVALQHKCYTDYKMGNNVKWDV